MGTRMMPEPEEPSEGHSADEEREQESDEKGLEGDPNPSLAGSDPASLAENLIVAYEERGEELHPISSEIADVEPDISGFVKQCQTLADGALPFPCVGGREHEQYPLIYRPFLNRSSALDLLKVVTRSRS